MIGERRLATPADRALELSLRLAKEVNAPINHARLVDDTQRDRLVSLQQDEMIG